jgi:hypothetical protein
MRIQCKVTFAAEEVARFNRRWPGSPIPEEPITFHFQDLELIEIESETPAWRFDSPALLALSHEARCHCPPRTTT